MPESPATTPMPTYTVPAPDALAPIGARVQLATIYGAACNLDGSRMVKLKPLAGTVVGHTSVARPNRGPLDLMLVDLDTRAHLYLVTDDEALPTYSGSMVGIILVAAGNFVTLDLPEPRA